MNAGSNWLLISLDCIPNVSKKLHWNEADCLLNKVEGFDDKGILLLYCTMYMDAMLLLITIFIWRLIALPNGWKSDKGILHIYEERFIKYKIE